MRSTYVLSLLLASIAHLEGVLAQDAAPQGAVPNDGLQLDPAVISNNAKVDGSPLKAGQAPSTTSNNNFINFCQGKTITDGRQNIVGSCNPMPMGDIPAKERMVSTIILQPANGAVLEPNVPFTVQLQTQNLIAGRFTNPDVTYYNAPQQLENGIIVGHAHVTIQNIGTGTSPPDPATTAFFKGIDDAGNGQGLLQTTVDTGLPEGNFRICTMMSSSNHQPVLMPVARRGAQDDCIRVSVGAAAAPPPPPADPNAGAQPPADPNAGAQPPADPNAGAQPPADPNAGAQPPADPNAGAQPPADPNAGAQPPADPNAGAQPPADPNAGAQPPADPNAGAQPPADPNAGAQPPADPNAGAQPPADPNAGAQPPADNAGTPPAADPNAGAGAPPAADPNAGAGTPPADPNAGAATPPAAGTPPANNNNNGGRRGRGRGRGRGGPRRNRGGRFRKFFNRPMAA